MESNKLMLTSCMQNVPIRPHRHCQRMPPATMHYSPFTLLHGHLIFDSISSPTLPTWFHLLLSPSCLCVCMFVFCCTCVQSTAGESHPLSCMWSGQANLPQTGKDVACSPDQHHCQGMQVPPTWRHYSPSRAKYSCCTQFTALQWTSIGCKFLLGQVTIFQKLGNGLASMEAASLLSQ